MATSTHELRLLEVWIPERMTPGTLFIFESPRTIGDSKECYPALLACPQCGIHGLITIAQLTGTESMTCGDDHCSAEYFLRNEQIEYRTPQ